MSKQKDYYLKFHFKDFRTDPKLCRCSALSNGVYIHIMCLLCDTEERGKFQLNSECMTQFAGILPQQNAQQTNQQTNRQFEDICRCFAGQLVKHLPFYEKEVFEALIELLTNNVLYLEQNFLCQKRMIKDASISKVRSKSGKAGAKKTNSKKTEPKEDLPIVLPQQKEQQNPNYNYNYNSNYKEGIDKEGVSNNTGGGTGESFIRGEKEKGEVKRVELTKVDMQIFQKNSEEFIEAWIDWETHLAEQDKKPHTLATRKSSYENLVKISEYDEERAISIIRKSIGNRWVTFNYDFQKNGNGNGTKNQQKNQDIPEPPKDASPEEWESYWKKKGF